jgi:hypothetical protein
MCIDQSAGTDIITHLARSLAHTSSPGCRCGGLLPSCQCMRHWPCAATTAPSRAPHAACRSGLSSLAAVCAAVPAPSSSPALTVSPRRVLFRARDAAVSAISSPLLEVGIERATGIVWNITGGSDLTLFEVNQAAEIIYDLVDPEARPCAAPPSQGEQA